MEKEASAEFGTIYYVLRVILCYKMAVLRLK